jgi:prepilin-type processing-associated H-X9-DG protein
MYSKSSALRGSICPSQKSPRQWAHDFPNAARKGWQYYQALRHAGRANVLFCDGHIEPLSAEDLEYMDPRWVYEGR